MRAHAGDVPILEHHDQVGKADRRRPLGDDERRGRVLHLPDGAAQVGIPFVPVGRTVIALCVAVDNLRQELRSVMAAVFSFLQRNKEFAVIISNYKADSLFFSWVRSEIFRRGLSEWQRIYGFRDSLQWEYYLDFVVAGCVSMLQSWIKKGMRDDPEEMGALAERVILYGPGEVLG